MAFRSLTTQTMVNISDAWLDPAGDYPLIASLPQAGALIPSLGSGHKGLLAFQADGDNTSRALRALQERELMLDGVHDRKTRGGYTSLSSVADLSDDPKLAAACVALRDRLYPHGTEVINWSYTDEAGEARLADARLTDEEKALLASLPYPGGTLLDAHNARVAAGRELGKLERQRATLEAKDPSVTTRADVVRARNKWIRTVNAFIALLNLEENLSDEDREKILGPLRREEQKVDRKRAAEIAAEEEADEEEPDTTGTAPATGTSPATPATGATPPATTTGSAATATPAPATTSPTAPAAAATAATAKPTETAPKAS